MKKILVILCFVVISAFASQKAVLMTQSVHHTLTENKSEYYNNKNGGVGLEWTDDDSGFGIHALGYHNSYYKMTLGIGPHYEHDLGPVTGSIAVTFASGYEHLGVKYLPLPTVGLQYGYVRVITTMPFMLFTPYDSVTSLHFVFPF